MHPLILPAGEGLDTAVGVLQDGGVVAYPTEAVFGLGCDPLNQGAVRRLLAIKRRAAAKGLILIAADWGQLTPYVMPLGEERMAEIRSSWPGPYTWLLPVRPETPMWLRGGFETLAVRVTAHPLAAALCRTYGGAIVSTSANRAGRAPARRALEVRLRLRGQVDYLLAGDCGGARRPSAIRDGRTGTLLRA